MTRALVTVGILQSLALGLYGSLSRGAPWLFAGSAIVYWDNGPVRAGGTIGNGPAPLENTPPREGHDSHYGPRTTPAARQQKAEFLLTGNVRNVCGNAPCAASGESSP